MTNVDVLKPHDCYVCQGTGKVTLVPWTDAPIWEREKESVEIQCDCCKKINQY